MDTELQTSMTEIDVMKQYVENGELTIDQAREMIRLRYSNEEVSMEADVDGFTPFGFKIRKVTDKGKSMLNGERNMFSYENKRLLIESNIYTKTNVIKFLIIEGEDVTTHEIKNFGGRMLYWHPFDEDIVVWFDGQDCWFYNVKTKVRQLYFSSDFRLTDSGGRVAGGDGNDIDRMSGRMVVGDKNGEMAILNFFTGELSEPFSFSKLDYARFHGGKVVFVGDGKGTFLYDPENKRNKTIISQR
jgi:hypothetical protein